MSVGSVAELEALDRAVQQALATLEQLKQARQGLEAELAELKRALSARPEPAAPPDGAEAPDSTLETAGSTASGDTRLQLVLLRREREEIRSRVGRLLQQIEEL